MASTDGRLALDDDCRGRTLYARAESVDAGHGVTGGEVEAADLVQRHAVNFMEEWFGWLFFGLFVSIFGGQLIGGEVQARRVRRMWAAIANEHGWQFEPGGGKVKAKLGGRYQGCTFNLLACINYLQKAPAVYTEVMFVVGNVDDIILYSNWPKPTFFDSSGSTHPNLKKLKSGDGLFDGSYRFYGTPVEQTQAVLQSYAVRSAIRKLYPLNAAQFEHPTLKLQKGVLYLRTYYLHDQAAELQKFIADACQVAEILAEAGKALNPAAPAMIDKYQEGKM